MLVIAILKFLGEKIVTFIYIQKVLKDIPVESMDLLITVNDDLCYV